MGATDIITYMKYIAAWNSMEDQYIDHMIFEFTTFLKLTDFDPDHVIDEEVMKLTDLVQQIHDDTVAVHNDRTAMYASVGFAIMTLGMGWEATPILRYKEREMESDASKKTEELRKDDKDLLTILASKMGCNVEAYVKSRKVNNTVIIEQAPRGMDISSCRAIMMQFMAGVKNKAGSIDVQIFKKDASMAREFYNRGQIENVYDVFDTLEKFAARTGSAIDIIDVTKSIQSVTDVSEHYGQLLTQLKGPFKQRYKDYFNNIRIASQKFRNALGLN